MNGGPATGGAPVGGAAPDYQGKGKKLKSIGQGIAPSGKTSSKGSKARVRKVKVQTKAVKAVMPGNRRSG